MDIHFEYIKKKGLIKPPRRNYIIVRILGFFMLALGMYGDGVYGESRFLRYGFSSIAILGAIYLFVPKNSGFLIGDEFVKISNNEICWHLDLQKEMMSINLDTVSKVRRHIGVYSITQKNGTISYIERHMLPTDKHNELDEVMEDISHQLQAAVLS